jgi:putative addiction module component (TIGR02574 family)
MPTTAALLNLPVADRLALIDELWASIPDSEVRASPEQVEVAASRLRELKANPAMGLSYDQIKARLG